MRVRSRLSGSAMALRVVTLTVALASAAWVWKAQERPPTPPSKPSEGSQAEEKKKDAQDIDKPPKIYGHDLAMGCPQVHNGCAALVIDIPVSEVWSQPFGNIHEILRKGLGCEVDYVKADFVDPESVKSLKQQQEIKDKNTKLWQEIREAIKSHLEHINNKGKARNLVIELIGAHGAQAPACGYWADWFSDEKLDRAELLLKIRKEADKKVCSWFIYDSSCYSGLTPKAMDEVENLGTATCKAPENVDHPKHVGYWADLGAGTASADQPCTSIKVFQEFAWIREAIEVEARAPVVNYSSLVEKLWEGIQKEVQPTSYYADRGHKGDATDPQSKHERNGY